MKIGIVGAGYVGLVTGTCLAELGNDVTLVDIDKEKITRLQHGEVPIYEPDLEVYFKRNIEKGRLHFTNDLPGAVLEAKAVFLALPTPQQSDGSANISSTMKVAHELGRLLKDYTVIINKSTVPPGTAEKVREAIAEHTTEDFDVVSNPEFLKEGFAVTDFMNPHIVVVGATSESARKVMREIYNPVTKQHNLLFETDPRTAELIKYANNAFLAMKVTFANEIANLCSAIGADYHDLHFAIGKDPRIGKEFLFPGPGFGGSCFPKDVKALLSIAEILGVDLGLVEATDKGNELQKGIIPKKIKEHYGKDLEGKTFAVWGLAFKPNTDDIRESPAIAVINSLLKAGAQVVAYDPEAMGNVKKDAQKLIVKPANLSFAEDRDSALVQADGLVILTNWKEFFTPDFAKMKSLMREPAIFDGRNIYSLESVRGQGVYYDSLGRDKVLA